MAEIKIERKQSSSWLWWVLGLIVLALLAWWLVAANTDDRETAAAGGDVATPVATTNDGVITELGTLTAATAGDLAGRSVMLGSAPVQDVVSDKGFWVGDATNRVFVVRGDQSSPATPPDGAVNAGQTVAVWGVAERMPSDLTQQNTTWNLRATDSEALARQSVYVQADSVRILSR